MTKPSDGFAKIAGDDLKRGLPNELPELRGALRMLLDQIDYTRGNCRVTEMIGAVLSREAIAVARCALREDT